MGSSLRKIWVLALCMLLTTTTWGQIPFTQASPTVTFDFSAAGTPASVGTNPGSAFNASGFTPDPASPANAGKLNSNTWEINSNTTPHVVFGGNVTSGINARGAANGTGTVTQGGLYAYTGAPASTSNPMLLIQPTTDYMTKTNNYIGLRFINNDPNPIVALRFKYDVLYRNDKDRAMDITFRYSSDGTNFSDAPALNFSTPITSTGSAISSPTTLDHTITGFFVPQGQYGYVRMYIADGAGASGSERDEIFLDNFLLEATFEVPCTPPTVHANTISYTNIGPSQMDLNFTRGNGTGGILIVAVQNATLSSLPANGLNYTANSTFGLGSAIGNGYVVYNGNPVGANSFTVFGLSAATNYRFYFFEYNNDSYTCYYTTSAPNHVRTTTTPVTNPNGYFRTRNSGSWQDLNVWQSSNDGITWNPADLKPTSAAAGILIRSPHTVTLTAPESGRLVTIEPGAMLTSTNGNVGGHAFTLVDDGTAAFDMIVGGVLEIFGNSPINDVSHTATKMEVLGGGEIRVSNNYSPNQADDLAHLINRTTFRHQAIYNWNTNLATFQNSGFIYFNPAPPLDTIPIFRISQQPAFSIGGNSNTIINGILEVNAPITFYNAGTKVIRNGIIGSGNVTQDPNCGPISFYSTVTPPTNNPNRAYLGGSGVITLSNGGMIIQSTTTTYLISDKTINNGTLTINGNTSLGSNNSTYLFGSLLCQGENQLKGSVNLVVNERGILGLGSINGFNNTTGNIQTTGTRTFHANSAFYYNGLAGQVTGNDLPNTIGYLLLDSATVGKSLLVNKDLTITATIFFHENILKIGDGITLNCAVSLSQGLWYPKGTTANYFQQPDKEMGFDGTPTSTLMITATVTGALNLYFPYPNGTLGKLIFDRAGSTQIAIGSAPLEIFVGIEPKQGQINFNGGSTALRSVVLKSTIDGTAYFGNATNATVSNAQNFTIERYIPAGVNHAKSWQFLNVPLYSTTAPSIHAAWQEGASAPNADPNPGYGTMITGNLPNATDLTMGFDEYTPNSSTIKTFDPLTGTWISSVTNTKTTPVVNGKGYMIFVRGDRSVTTYNAPATPTVLRAKGQIHLPGAFVPSFVTVPANQFASVGNPYASTIDFSAISRSGGLDNTFYVWDPLLNGQNGYGGFQTISATTGYLPVPGGTTNYPSGVPVKTIQNGQAFLVHATGSNGNLVFEEHNKVTSTDMVFRPSRNTVSLIHSYMLYQDSVMTDGNIVVLDNRYSNAYDGNDARKYFNDGENFYVEIDGNYASVDARKVPNQIDTVHYRIYGMKNGRYTLVIQPQNVYLNANMGMYLIDRFSNTETELRTDAENRIEVTFSNASGSKASNRFVLVFKSKNIPPRYEREEKVRISPNPLMGDYIQLFMENVPAGVYQVSVRSIDNWEVAHFPIQVVGSNYIEKLYLPRNLRSGVYFVTIKNQYLTWTIKVIKP